MSIVSVYFTNPKWPTAVAPPAAKTRMHAAGERAAVYTVALMTPSAFRASIRSVA
jgi:hypothetical protein